jgi:hypothetical protein
MIIPGVQDQEKRLHNVARTVLSFNDKCSATRSIRTSFSRYVYVGSVGIIYTSTLTISERPSALPVVRISSLSNSNGVCS